MLYNTEFPIIKIHESDKEISIDSGAECAVIVTSEDYSQKDNKALLEKILQSTGTSLSQFQILIYENLDFDLINALERQNIQKIIVFGTELQNLGLKIKEMPYYVFKYSGKLLLKGHSLSEISEDSRKKQRLWTCLKKIFHEKN